MAEDLLAVNIKEAARRISVSDRTLWNLIARGEIPVRRVGRRRLIRVLDLENFLKRDHKTGNEADSKGRNGR